MFATAVLLLGVVGVAPDGGPPSARDLLAAGDAAWQSRGDPARLSEALDDYRQAAERDPGDGAAELRLARAEAFRALRDPGVGADAWPRASRAAERALRRLAPRWAAAVDAGDARAAAASVDASGAEALYWLSLAAYSAAQLKGFGAVLAVKDVAIASMERAAELDPRIDCAGPHRALGAWRAGLPVAVGGGAEHARVEFEKALAIGPQCQLSRVREAETLFVLLQDRKSFEATLREVLASAGSDGPWEPENALARGLARELLDREGRLF
ncbi:MAG TPA: TRAP transporter TatT component family protein [Anaeromyxobacteraceae bacterium]|nr:TRAP transporter TatT component family protein [Anaeromyxobacteraceae bacterium]